MPLPFEWPVLSPGPLQVLLIPRANKMEGVHLLDIVTGASITLTEDCHSLFPFWLSFQLVY